MNVNKNILEKKTDKELEEYIKPDSRFVPVAIKYALEILQSRGRNFTDDEIEKINILTNRGQNEQEIFIHENYKKSSNLIYISAGLGLLNFMLSKDLLDNKSAVISGLITVFIIVFLGFLIRKGFNSIKYGLFFLLSFGLYIYIPYLINDLKFHPINGIINITQSSAQIYAVILLYMIPKE